MNTQYNYNNKTNNTIQTIPHEEWLTHEEWVTQLIHVQCTFTSIFKGTQLGQCPD